MSTVPPSAAQFCTQCGKPLLPGARHCAICGSVVGASAAASAPQELNFLLPVNRAGSAIVAGYMGLLALFPLCGGIASIAAIICGIKALQTLKANPQLHGRGRAWFGIIAGAVTLPCHGLGVLALLANWGR